MRIEAERAKIKTYLQPHDPHADRHEAGHRRCLEAAALIQALEDAGATLLALPHSGHSTRMRQMRFDIVHTALEAYGWAPEQVRAPVPDAAAITAMDAAFALLALIPEQKFVMRRIVGARALVHPLTRRHLYPWRRLAGVLGADHKSIQRWHGDGIRLIVTAVEGKSANGMRHSP
jgi:hypothetical protein